MSAENPELMKAMERQSPAIISAGDGAARRDLLVQFTSCRKEANAPGFWARVHEGDSRVIDQLIKSAQSVDVTFNTRSAKVQFKTSLLKRRRHNLMQRLLLLSWPQHVQVLEQRQKPRQFIPDRYRLSAKLRVLSPRGDNVGEMLVRVWDLGLSGASLICPMIPIMSGINKDSSLAVILRPPDSEKEYTLAAKQRYATGLTDEKLRLGVQFAPATPATAAAHRALKAIIEELDAKSGSLHMLGALRTGEIDNSLTPKTKS